jgi:hypothetical protein
MNESLVIERILKGLVIIKIFCSFGFKKKINGNLINICCDLTKINKISIANTYFIKNTNMVMITTMEDVDVNICEFGN